MPIHLGKPSKLEAIQADAQIIAEAISAIIELDTIIVDETLMVVAGTGRFKKRVGIKEEDGDLQAGYLYGRVITKGKAEIVEDAPNDPLYDPSVQTGTTEELANNGTIFLDEIGDMPLRLQPKLLHILQTKMVERLGGVKPISANARVIASTNRDIESMITENEFRSDLFYRLNVIPIHIPPLRVRTEDMLIMLDRFLEKFCRNEGKQINGISEDVKDLFVSYIWPGNVRELENTVEYMASMTTKDIITMDIVPARIKKQRRGPTPPDMSLAALLQSYEKTF